jgi:autotransporter-associated beta strand protein
VTGLIGRCRRFFAFVILIGALSVSHQAVWAQRVLGLDVSRNQGTISSQNWIAAFNGGRKFVFIRATRGGTTGVYKPGGGYPFNDNDEFSLSQRYDDPYFVEWINNSTAAGLFAGAYHFGRADIVASTPNANGIPNDPVDEANHFLEMAGAWLRPGYLLPVYDFEGVENDRTDNQLADFSRDFSDRIFQVTGVRPIMYTNGSHAQNVLGDATNPTPAQTVATFPNLWISRYPAGSGNPYQGDIQTENPSDTVSWVYGPWDDPAITNNPEPWVFWQYSSGETITGIPDPDTDGDVAQGDIEFVKDRLIPAMWSKDDELGVFRNGDWNELEMWNSGDVPVAPPPHSERPLQLVPSATGPLPTQRVAGGAGPGSTSGIHDTVILDVPTANVTVTHSSGSHNMRKLFMRETLNITGGSLTVNYDPLYNFNIDNPYAQRSGSISAQFSGPVTMSGGAFSVHTLQVDATRTFTLSGGAITFDTINLLPHASSPARIALNGNVTVVPLNNGNPRNDLTATIVSTGSGSSGFIDLGGGTRTISVQNGAASIDLSVNVPIVNGGLIKSGLGTMVLNANNTFSGPVTIDAGVLRYGHSSGLSIASVVTINGGATLEMNNFSDAIAGLAGGGAITQGAASLAIGSSSGSNSFSGVVTGTGSLSKTGNSSQTFTGNNTLGAVNVHSGSLYFNDINTTGAVTVNSGGTLAGSGSVSGEVTVHSGGHLAPGPSIGDFDVGSLTLNAGAMLDFDLALTAASDRIDASGLLTIIGGTVNITNHNGLLSAGTYTLIDYGTISGSVASLGTPVGPANFTYSLSDNGSAIRLTVASVPEGVPGDYNNDGTVDMADYVVWSKNYDTDNPLPNDDDIGGTVGEQHFELWQQHFGQTWEGAGGSQADVTVPEPMSGLLLLLGIATVFLGRRSQEALTQFLIDGALCL